MYLFVYIFVCLFAIFLGLRVFRLTRNISGAFFLGFTIFLSIWFSLYFLYFVDFIKSPTVLLYLSRINFIVGLTAVYNLLFFVMYFNVQKPKIGRLKYILLPIHLGLIVMYIFSGYIIETLRFSPEDGVYREVYGSLYFVTIILYLIFLIGFIIISFVKLRRASNLNKIRISRIIYAAYFMLFMMLSLQLFLPLLDIWILEKEIIFFYLYFVVQTHATLKRYYFGSIGYGVGRVVIYLMSLAISIGVYLASISMMKEELNMGKFWNFDDPFSIINLIFSIAVFHLSHKVISFWLLGNGRNESLKESIFALQKEIVPTIDYESMNAVLSKSLKGIFGVDMSRVIIFACETESYKNTKKYFEFGFSDNIYIHDIVFQESRRSSFDTEKLSNELPNGTFLMFPIFSDDVCVGVFVIGVKSFGDFYTKEEIKVLRNLSYFLSSHVKYIETYNELQDLSLNLDKKVDEKTIEYNDLINRQKEFIGVISHEIKSPISAAIFQSDSIIDDLKGDGISPENLKEELAVLNSQLVRTGGLITKLFSVQYYDTHAVNLFREKVEFATFLENEIELFSHMHSDIIFTSKIDKKIGFVDIDKIQFQQVINNLLDNAVKFLDVENPTISVQAKKIGTNLQVTIEDNGRGFQGIEIHDIFDKYTTGKKGSIGLGMGLYLCKKIISMHNGTIEASNGKNDIGARFIITLPLR